MTEELEHKKLVLQHTKRLLQNSLDNALWALGNVPKGNKGTEAAIFGIATAITMARNRIEELQL